MFYFYPTVKELGKIMTTSMNEDSVIVYTSDELIINQIINSKIGILSEKSHKNLTLINKISLIDQILIKLELQISSQIKNKLIDISENFSLFDLCFQYKYTKNIDLIKKNNTIDNIKPIEFFRSNLKKLQYWNSFKHTNLFGKFSIDKQIFLQDVIYRLEYVFKRTGLQKLHVYFYLMLRVL